MSLLGSFTLPVLNMQISILALAASAAIAFSGFSLVGPALGGGQMGMIADAALVYFAISMLEPMLSGALGGTAA